MELCSLPTPVLASISTLLPFQSVLALASTSNFFRDFVDRHDIWVDLCERDFGKEIRSVQRQQFKKWQLLYKYLFMSKEDIKVKMVVIGNFMVGKTALLSTYTNDEFPEEYLPTIFSNYEIEKKKGIYTLQLQLQDTGGSEQYDRLRPLSYPGVDVVIMCFSTISKDSYDSIKSNWFPEICHFLPMVPILLVGTKIDLRESHLPDGTFVTFQMGKKLAQEIKAEDYLEVSSKTKHGLQELFEKAIDCSCKSKNIPSIEQIVNLMMREQETGNRDGSKKKSKNCITM
eukprot:Phypoly_transcript_15335.p1 GENE.Phypoly_transcript_15335~~Phypoly_transcript_15335.p1  ORF type:complete len:286 (+),score=38.90 Phypoly_transcript_15335:73-930(+)